MHIAKCQPAIVNANLSPQHHLRTSGHTIQYSRIISSKSHKTSLNYIMSKLVAVVNYNQTDSKHCSERVVLVAPLLVACSALQ